MMVHSLFQNKDAAAWLAMVAALALHVVDEALNDFLAFYNPFVEDMRESLGYFPMPTFELSYWLGGLIVAVAIGFLVTPRVAKGVRGIKIVMIVLGILMVANALGHLLGSWYRGALIPGFWSSFLLLPTSVWVTGRGFRRSRGGSVA